MSQLVVLADELWDAETSGVKVNACDDYRACGHEGKVPFNENEER
jgi:hypothetical protein